ncbi:MAG: histidinol-phosphatase, partial [Clostridia bacterium]|nr:histidinol-phosphatase [Clostridia bacterium]
MIPKTDFHIHTSFCDGLNTPEQIVNAAIEKNFSAIGFTGHSYTSFDVSYCMSKENTKSYFDTVNRLKYKYEDKIDIFCGIEQDFYAEAKELPFEYTIGSVHYIKVGDRYLAIDDNAQATSKIIDECFFGDFDAFAKEYFYTVKNVIEKTNADIIGHFDVILKYKHGLNLKESDTYLEYAFNALDELIKYNKPFEINVGAVNSGYRNSPYPSVSILKEIKRLGGKIIITGDCHNEQNLGKNFDFAVSYAKAAGFKKAEILTNEGFK